ncbi:MAG: tol-pal system protein YbgF [Deltaproteobacteria bacterium]|nr:tol-pal system protein YbgF [Deltaproteobacteria bacterium]
MRGELAKLQGAIDELSYRVSHGAGTPVVESEAPELEDRLADLSRRIAAVEKYLGLKPPPASAVAGGATAADVPEPGSESDLYQKAKTTLDNGETARARKLFLEFLKKFPASRNADNARFWIGETYYQEKWYEKSILEYQKVIEDFPKGNKVPAALLKQGMAFAQLEDPGNAKLMWEELVRRFPGSTEAGIARKKLDALE